MRNLQRDDLPALEELLHLLNVAGSFTADEVDCALELLHIVLDQPQQRDYLVLVSESEVRVTGYILYGPVPLTASTYDIYWLAVHPECHGHGYGRRLVKAAEQALTQSGASMICLETSSKDNYARTRLFYENAGYQQESVIADFYGPNDDRITYVKRLSRGGD
ncbi:MAG: GNAT family N-acetyltransferase [Desulfuromonas sp.]|nr:GNAT family N-acetyltransferase [Desulfuromonas sp.]